MNIVDIGIGISCSM